MEIVSWGTIFGTLFIVAFLFGGYDVRIFSPDYATWREMKAQLKHLASGHLNLVLTTYYIGHEEKTTDEETFRFGIVQEHAGTRLYTFQSNLGRRIQMSFYLYPPEAQKMRCILYSVFDPKTAKGGKEIFRKEIDLNHTPEEGFRVWQEPQLFDGELPFQCELSMSGDTNTKPDGIWAQLWIKAFKTWRLIFPVRSSKTGVEKVNDILQNLEGYTIHFIRKVYEGGSKMVEIANLRLPYKESDENEHTFSEGEDTIGILFEQDDKLPFRFKATINGEVNEEEIYSLAGVFEYETFLKTLTLEIGGVTVTFEKNETIA